MTFAPIKLTSKKHLWNVEDSSLGYISEDGVFVSKDQEGLTGINVVDATISNNTAESSIKVAYPHSIDVSVADVTTQIVD